MDHSQKKEISQNTQDQFHSDIEVRYPNASAEEKQKRFDDCCAGYLEGRKEGVAVGRDDSQAEVSFLHSLGEENSKLALAKHLANLKEMMDNAAKIDIEQYELFLNALLAAAFLHGAYIKSKLDAGITQKDELLKLLQALKR